MKRGGMGNFPKIDMEKVKQAAPQNSPAPIVNTLRESVKNMTGNTVTLDVRGQPVKFTLRTLPAEHVERKTMVWGQNERLQELLNETSLDDLLTTFRIDGQQFPAFGREVNGIIEIADGSRRRKAAIITQCEYRVLVGDLDDDQMSALSEVGNDYRPTSAYERGRRYQRLIEQVYGGSLKSMSEREHIARRVVIRCVATAELPIDVIKLFSNPSELSARSGEELSKVYKANSEKMMERVAELQLFKDAGEDLETDVILKALKGVSEQKEKTAVTVRNFGSGITAKYKGDSVEFMLKGVSPELIKRIEFVLAASENPGDGKEVNKLFEKLEKSMGR